MKRIELEWFTYHAQVLPPNVSDVQVRETRKAFYAGAQALYALLMNQLSSEEAGHVGVEKDMQLLSEVDKELKWFCSDVQKGAR